MKLTEAQRALLEELRDLGEESSVEVLAEDRPTVDALYRKGLVKFVTEWDRTQTGLLRADIVLTTAGWCS